MKSALTLLTKSVFIPVGLKGAASETDAAVQKKIWTRHEATDNL